jgi:hypothetical protein
MLPKIFTQDEFRLRHRRLFLDNLFNTHRHGTCSMMGQEIENERGATPGICHAAVWLRGGQISRRRKYA